MSQWLPNHPNIVDPSTGEPLRALTVIGNMPVWPSYGAQDENEDGSESSETEGDDSQGGDDAESTEQEQQETSNAVTREEFERVMNRMKAADRRASAAEARVKEFEDAGKSELEKLQTERENAAKERDEARQALQSERIANAFLASNSVTWHDPEDALAMLRTKYMEGVEISEDGKISGMKKAIEKMAKEKSYLVNAVQSSASTGDQMNGKRKGDAKDERASKDDELKKRMPALGQF